MVEIFLVYESGKSPAGQINSYAGLVILPTEAKLLIQMTAIQSF